ncbi:MAG: Gfo/Idh/MocA family oxidoreductase [Planctomycetes bacterium]|nr:Gfo/Idh/MocA family oxidoreductase [Planctomycetota bacterium]
MKIAFIGVGGIAGNYRSSLKTLGRPVAAVCDINAERAAKAAQEESAAAYTDHRAMLKKEKPEVVFVCIPPGAHAGQAADAAKAGAALFVAKPVSNDLKVARKTREVIAEARVINQAGYMARYSDVTQKAKEIVGARALGMGFGRFLCRMGATHPWWGKFKMSGGQMLEQSTHVFDYLRYFLGEVAEVQAFGKKNVSRDIADFEECTVCNLRFASGAVGNITSTCVAGGEDGFAAELVGDNLYLKVVMDTKLRGRVDGEAVSYDGEERGYFRQVEQFLKAVETRDQRMVRTSYEDAVRTLAVTVAANRSLVTGRGERVEV